MWSMIRDLEVTSARDKAVNLSETRAIQDALVTTHVWYEDNTHTRNGRKIKIHRKRIRDVRTGTTYLQGEIHMHRPDPIRLGPVTGGFVK